MSIQYGDVIRLEFKIRLENGNLVDSSEKHGGPIKIQVGAGQILKSLENELIGMKVGQ